MHTDNTPINKHRICCLKSILSSPEIIILFLDLPSVKEILKELPVHNLNAHIDSIVWGRRLSLHQCTAELRTVKKQ